MEYDAASGSSTAEDQDAISNLFVCEDNDNNNRYRRFSNTHGQ